MSWCLPRSYMPDLYVTSLVSVSGEKNPHGISEHSHRQMAPPHEHGGAHFPHQAFISTFAWGRNLINYEDRMAFEKAKSRETLPTLIGFCHWRLNKMPHPHYHFLQHIHLSNCSQMITGACAAKSTKPQPMPAFRFIACMPTWPYLAEDMVSLSLCIC